MQNVPKVSLENVVELVKRQTFGTLYLTREWLKEWAKYLLTTENTDCASARRLLKVFSVFFAKHTRRVQCSPW